MSKIFKQQRDYVKPPKRNNFDLSYSTNFTTKFGQLTPILCKEVVPGDKFNIDFTAGLRALPLAFPIQTPVQAEFSFFYVRNRTLWKDWQDFFGRTKEGLEHPYISIPYTRADEIGTGTLADFLGVPTTYTQSMQSDFFPFQLHGNSEVSLDGLTSGVASNIDQVQKDQDENVISHISGTLTPDNGTITALTGSNLVTPIHNTILLSHVDQNTNFNTGVRISDLYYRASASYSSKVNDYFSLHSDLIDCGQSYIFKLCPVSDYSPILPYTDVKTVFSIPDPARPDYNNSLLVGGIYSTSIINDDGTYKMTINNDLSSISNLLSTGYYMTILVFDTETSVLNTDGTNNLFGSRILVNGHYISTHDVSATSNPFVVQQGESVPDIKLSALSFRAYEAICNSWYRNSNGVDPFTLNGVAEYNRYCTNLDGGADSTTPLNLRFRNYELDAFTSCVLTPQQGLAPLVGVSATGKFTFKDENDQEFSVTPVIGSDGDTLTGIDSYSSNTPESTIMRLQDLIKYGISISDFRNVNSLQRWAEINIRRGLRYKEQLMSHFGVDARFNELDMPEYLGGATRQLSVQQISATAETTEMKLGDYGGQMGLFTQNKHSVTHYFDEPGFVFCIMCVVPIPNYSQMLDKKLLKENVLSYYFPEFRNISMQPIDYNIVTPIQAKLYGTAYTDTFGYQRPYWDLISSYDEVHGKMRTDLQGFLLTRTFSTPPLLGHDFIVINPDDITNPFVEESAFGADQFIGQVSFDIKAKRPLSRIHVPSLE